MKCKVHVLVVVGDVEPSLILVPDGAMEHRVSKIQITKILWMQNTIASCTR
jgi:hypothetical protein